MIPFQIQHSGYWVGGTPLPLDELVSYPHEIEGDRGYINLPISIGDEVMCYPSTLDRAAESNGKKVIISGFCVFGEKLCARFEGSAVPYSVECISPV